MSDPKKKTARRWAAGGLLLALALMGGGGLWLQGSEAPSPAPAEPGSPSAQTPSAARPVPGGLAAPAASQAASKPEGERPGMDARPKISAAQLAQIEAQWCTHGMLAHRQSEESVLQGEGGAVNTADPQAMDRMVNTLRALPTTQTQEAVRQRMLVAWVERLERQGDPRSLATALYLRVHHAAGWSETAEAAFRQQAATTTDPYVLNLWRLHDRACSLRGDCRAVPAERWSAIEPDNLLAWLPPGWGPVRLSEAQWAGVAQAKYLRSYHRDLQLALLPLARELTPGLELDVALTFILQVNVPPAIALDRFASACLPEAARQQHRQACLHGADLLWHQPQAGLMDVAQALAIAKGLHADGEGPWPARMAEAMALGNFNTSEFHMLDMGAAPKVASCDGLPTRRMRLTEVVQQGSWRVAQREHAPAAR